MSSSPPPRKLTASLSTISSPIFLITSLRLRGCVPVDSSRPGTLPTLSRCALSLASTSARAEERAKATENVYLVKKAAYVGDCWKEWSSGGRPRRMRFPLILVSLYAKNASDSGRWIQDRYHSLARICHEVDLLRLDIRMRYRSCFDPGLLIPNYFPNECTAFRM